MLTVPGILIILALLFTVLAFTGRVAHALTIAVLFLTIERLLAVAGLMR